MNRSVRTTLRVTNTAIYVFLLAPLVIVAIASFGATSYLRFPPQGFTFEWFGRALSDGVYWSTFYTSLWVGVVSALAATVIGLLAAYALGRYRLRGSGLIGAFFLSPLIMPTLVFGVALLIFFATVWGPPGIWRLVAGHLVITIPYVIRTALPVIEQLDASLNEAAADLGASALTTARTITVPILAPTVLVSFGLAFLISFDELVLALFLAPPSAPTLPMQIYSNVQFGLDPTVGAVSTMLLVLTAVFMVVGQLITARFTPTVPSTTSQED